MSKPTIVPSTDYFITCFVDGETVANRIIAFQINEDGTTAITTGGGVEDCDQCYYDGYHTGIVDSQGCVASGGNVFKSVASFTAYVKRYFNPAVSSDCGTCNHHAGSFEVADSKHLH